ncbi:MAG: serine hydrolase, partial [Candidatus Phytoplasma australasiaticum]|nr:serine hydrolase [Candidatus Phytoplasma australasiaticum]
LSQVHHVLNHTSGLHNALASDFQENPLLMCDWDECLKRIAKLAPETEPGRQQQYHPLNNIQLPEKYHRINYKN